jgi:hypothetical protein
MMKRVRVVVLAAAAVGVMGATASPALAASAAPSDEASSVCDPYGPSAAGCPNVDAPPPDTGGSVPGDTGRFIPEPGNDQSPYYPQ